MRDRLGLNVDELRRLDGRPEGERPKLPHCARGRSVDMYKRSSSLLSTVPLKRCGKHLAVSWSFFGRSNALPQKHFRFLPHIIIVRNGHGDSTTLADERRQARSHTAGAARGIESLGLITKHRILSGPSATGSQMKGRFPQR